LHGLDWLIIGIIVLSAAAWMVLKIKNKNKH
jgi:hypothetical protein